MIDALMLLGENRFGRTVTVEAALGLADRLGLAGIVAAPARPMDYHLAPANEALAVTAGRSGGRLVSLGRIDPLDGDARTRDRRVLHHVGRADERHYGAVVIRVGGPVEDVGTGRLHRVDDREDDSRIAPFAEVRHGLKKSGRAHGIGR